jgi:hypothetical protein
VAVCRHIDLHPWIFVLIPLELFAAPPESRFVDCALDMDNRIVRLAITTPMAACPLCGSGTRTSHSRSIRRLVDLPCLGRAVQVRVTVRRFSCPQPECPRLIFGERLPGFAKPHARTTSRLRQAHESIGSALGGQAGSRVTIRLSLATSPDTLLRRVKQVKRGWRGTVRPGWEVKAKAREASPAGFLIVGSGRVRRRADAEFYRLERGGMSR